MSKCKDECADHVQDLLKQIEQLQSRLTTAEATVERLEEEARWIPVDEGPPEKDGPVWMCYAEDEYTYSGWYQPQYKLWQIFDPCGGYSDCDIKSPPSHWKPITLPKGPNMPKPVMRFPWASVILGLIFWIIVIMIWR